jgi:hypothetical protein
VIFVYKTDWGVSSKIYDEIITKIKEKFPLFSKGVWNKFGNKIRIDKIGEKIRLIDNFSLILKFCEEIGYKNS